MALQVWLPLNGDLTQQGLSGVEATNNGATVNNEGKIGKCYQFGTAASYMTLPAESMKTCTEASVSFWVKILSWNTSYATLFQAGTNGYSWQNYIFGVLRNSTSSTLCFTIGNGSTTSTKTCQTSTLELNTWYHLTFTYNNNGDYSIYINGVLNKKSHTDSIIPAFSQITMITLGRANGNGYQSNCLMNDVRIYDHCLSIKEVKELSKGLVLHYKLDDPYIESSITNLAKNVTYAVYNNHSAGGVTGSLTKLNETYQGCDIYRLTMTPNETYVSTFKTSLYNHGVYGFRNTFKASTKYCFWIYYRPVTHQDIKVGGTASNINGWTEIPSQKYSDEWYIVGQYRNGSVTEAKTDSIFTSICTPTAEAGVPISVDFCCPHLIEGYSEIKDTGNYQNNIETGIIFDQSGYGYNGAQLGALKISNDTVRYSNSINFNGIDDGILTENLPLSNIINSEITYSFWIKPNGESGARSVYFGSYSGTSWSIEKSAGNLLRLYWNGSPDETCTGATITDGIWQHVCIIKKGTNDVKVYINGQQKWASTAAHNTLIFPTTYRIGRDVRSGDGTPYKGLMSDFRIYATALSVEDVIELYHTAASIDKQGNLFCGEVVE